MSGPFRKRTEVQTAKKTPVFRIFSFSAYRHIFLFYRLYRACFAVKLRFYSFTSVHDTEKVTSIVGNCSKEGFNPNIIELMQACFEDNFAKKKTNKKDKAKMTDQSLLSLHT